MLHNAARGHGKGPLCVLRPQWGKGSESLQTQPNDFVKSKMKMIEADSLRLIFNLPGYESLLKWVPSAWLLVFYAAFTPKRTKSQFRAGARASSKQVPALSQLRTSWFHTGQSQPWSRREQRHDVHANVSAFPATLPPCQNCTIRRRTLVPVSNTTTISSSIQSVYGSFFEYSDLKQNQKKTKKNHTRIHVHCLLRCFKKCRSSLVFLFMKVRITPPPAPGVKAVLVLAQL